MVDQHMIPWPRTGDGRPTPACPSEVLKSLEQLELVSRIINVLMYGIINQNKRR